MQFLGEFDKAMNQLDETYHFLASPHQLVSSASEGDKVIVFERGELVFVFNFHPTSTYDSYKIGCGEPGKYRVALDSDSGQFGGQSRVNGDVDHFSSPEGIPGEPDTNFNNRPCSIQVLSPSRSCQVQQNQVVCFWWSRAVTPNWPKNASTDTAEHRCQKILTHA
eukprot:SM000154S01406  [mRNA]  locus=s154:85782:87939:- [translate_table: standard]